ncbi:MAG: hypothetical protein LBL99_00100 [Holosporaceae bacterium]|jgi:hypothetical protein|nr:hypothetical protein [Holosporaceae bacterium]
MKKKLLLLLVGVLACSTSATYAMRQDEMQDVEKRELRNLEVINTRLRDAARDLLTTSLNESIEPARCELESAILELLGAAKFYVERDIQTLEDLERELSEIYRQDVSPHTQEKKEIQDNIFIKTYDALWLAKTMTPEAFARDKEQANQIYRNVLCKIDDALAEIRRHLGNISRAIACTREKIEHPFDTANLPPARTPITDDDPSTRVDM